MSYGMLPPIGRLEIDEVLRSESTSEAASDLLRMALHEAERQCAEDRCIAALRDPREAVVAAAIIALGHIARIHRAISLERVLPELKRLRAAPALVGLLEDTLEDILLFACCVRTRPEPLA